MDEDGWEEIEDKGSKGNQTPNIPPVAPSPNSSFSFEEAGISDKIVITFYGEKGAGKTTTAMTLPGTKSVLCLDNKAQMVHKHILNNDKSVKVYDASKYYSKTPKTYLSSAETTYEYIIFLLDNIAKNPPDWIVVDGTEILHEVCEMLMRKHQDIRPYAGIANPNVWKERRQLMDSIFRKAVNSCKKGVVYTTYCKNDELIEDGNVVSNKKIPKWIDTLLYETDVVVFVENKHEKGASRILVRVDSSKIPNILKTGQVLDLTNKKLSDFIKGDE